jgi:Tfp pilus assembly protein PilE
VTHFDNISGLKQLLDIDTTLFKEELYYPWYVKKPGLISIIAAYSATIILSIIILAFYTDIKMLSILIVFGILTVIFSLAYLAIYKYQLEEAKSAALKPIMALERHEFIKSIQPFISSDQQLTAKQIAVDKVYTPAEYTSITLSTQSRVIRNTDCFIEDIERMLQHPDFKIQPEQPRGENYQITLTVPDKAKKNYEKIKSSSTFSDDFSVPDEVKIAIIKKVNEAITRAALGREAMLNLNGKKAQKQSQIRS